MKQQRQQRRHGRQESRGLLYVVLENAGRVQLRYEPVPQVVDEYAQLGQHAFPATEVTRFDGFEEAPVRRAIAQVQKQGDARQAYEQVGPVTMQRRHSRPKYRELDDAG